MFKLDWTRRNPGYLWLVSTEASRRSQELMEEDQQLWWVFTKVHHLLSDLSQDKLKSRGTSFFQSKEKRNKGH